MTDKKKNGTSKHLTPGPRRIADDVEDVVHQLGMWLDDLESGDDDWELKGAELAGRLRRTLSSRRAVRRGRSLADDPYAQMPEPQLIGRFRSNG